MIASTGVLHSRSFTLSSMSSGCGSDDKRERTLGIKCFVCDCLSKVEFEVLGNIFGPYSLLTLIVIF